QTGPLNGMTQEMCGGFWAWLPTDCASYDGGVPDASPADVTPSDSGPADAAPADVTPVDAAVDSGSAPLDAGATG
ncbi:MAG: hypothetical protein WCJ30_22165, partial [Deltaproteobacteria bacterium]